MKEYVFYYYNEKTGCLLECRQNTTTHEKALNEAELYAAWASVHYGCEVVYELHNKS